MKIYCSLKQVPELASLTCSERRRVHDACNTTAIFRNRRCLAAFLLMFVLMAVGFFIGVMLHNFFNVSAHGFIREICAGIGGGIGGFIFSEVTINYLRPYYADYIKTKLSPTRG